jgi:tRNA-Thr(GGU) m(6)t(6)A37 methyltransferase TsaA
MNIEPIGIIHSCFKEKFGIPRQSGLAKSASATLELLPPYNVEDALRGIDEYSHLWIVFAFHKSITDTFQPTVRPPRLGGNTRMGVFATRSPFRPNPIGLSVVELKGVNGTTLELAGGDFLDGTPVLDIKPYVPYADSIPTAQGSFAHTAPEPANTVVFSEEAEAVFQTLEKPQRRLIRDMLSFNPRPAYQADDPDRVFGTRVFNLDVKWKHSGDTVTVNAIDPVTESS